jgi:hypothetical protein
VRQKHGGFDLLRLVQPATHARLFKSLDLCHVCYV